MAVNQADRPSVIARLLARRVIAVVRVGKAGLLLRVAEALMAGGVSMIEFSLGTPGALEQLESAAVRFGHSAVFGAGTVLSDPMARRAMDAGARFIVAPNLNPAVIQVCHRKPHDVVVIPGGLTPAEIQAAWEMGADLVKVFPARLGRPTYIREVLVPLPAVRLVPTGGITLDNAGEFLQAGAAAVAVGCSLVDERVVESGDWSALEDRARLLIGRIRQAEPPFGLIRPGGCDGRSDNQAIRCPDHRGNHTAALAASLAAPGGCRLSGDRPRRSRVQPGSRPQPDGPTRGLGLPHAQQPLGAEDRACHPRPGSGCVARALDSHGTRGDLFCGDLPRLPGRSM